MVEGRGKLSKFSSHVISSCIGWIVENVFPRKNLSYFSMYVTTKILLKRVPRHIASFRNQWLGQWGVAYLQLLLNPRHQRPTMLKKFSGNMDRRIRQISSKEKIVYQSTNASRYKLAKKSCSVFSTNPLKTSKFLLRRFFKKVFIAIISGKKGLVFPPTHLHIKVSKVFRYSF